MGTPTPRGPFISPAAVPSAVLGNRIKKRRIKLLPSAPPLQSVVRIREIYTWRQFLPSEKPHPCSRHRVASTLLLSCLSSQEKVPEFFFLAVSSSPQWDTASGFLRLRRALSHFLNLLISLQDVHLSFQGPSPPCPGACSTSLLP